MNDLKKLITTENKIILILLVIALVLPISKFVFIILLLIVILGSQYYKNKDYGRVENVSDAISSRENIRNAIPEGWEVVNIYFRDDKWSAVLRYKINKDIIASSYDKESIQQCLEDVREKIGKLNING